MRYKDPVTLKRLYWEEGMTQAEIAGELGCSSSTISKYMRKNDIKTRGPEYYMDKEMLCSDKNDVSEGLTEEGKETTECSECHEPEAPTIRTVSSNGNKKMSLFKKIWRAVLIGVIVVVIFGLSMWV